jgi:hypothetical protein
MSKIESLRFLTILENIPQLSLHEMNMIEKRAREEYFRQYRLQIDRINGDVHTFILNMPESKNMPIRAIQTDISYNAILIYFTGNHCLMFYTTGDFAITNSDNNGRMIDKNLIYYTANGVLRNNIGDTNWIDKSQSAIQLGLALQPNAQLFADWIRQLTILIRTKYIQ